MLVLQTPLIIYNNRNENGVTPEIFENFLKSYKCMENKGLGQSIKNNGLKIKLYLIFA